MASRLATVVINWTHPRVRLALYGLAALAVIWGGWFLVGRLFPSNPPGPTESQRRSDSLAITKPIDRALIDSSNARITVRGRATSAAEARASRNRHLADSLAAIADSAQKWHEAYVARDAEAIDLRLAVANLKADTVDLRQQLRIVNQRLLTYEDVNRGLSRDIEHLQHCKIARLINCPSRIQTAAMAAVAVIAVQRYRTR